MKTPAPTAIVYGGIKKIFSIALFISAFLAILAGIKGAAPPRWRPLNAELGPGMPSFFPLIRSGTTTVYDPNSNEIIVFAGLTNDPAPNPTPIAFNDVWYLTHANGMGGTPAWVNLIRQDLPGSPGPRRNHSAVYDMANDRMIIYGGCGSTIPGECQPLADSGGQVWVLSNASGRRGTPMWTSFTPSGAHPAPRQGHQAVYNATTNSMILWGGQNGSPDYCDPNAYHDVWVLSHANGIGGTPNWSQLQPTGGPPAGQVFSTAVYDSSNNIMIVFGGIGFVNGNCTVTNAAWALSNADGHGKGTPVWCPLTEQDATGSPPNRSEQLAVYAGSANTMTIFGGTVTAGSNPFSEQRLNDTWVLSHANGLGNGGLGGKPMWTRLPLNPEAEIPVKNYRWNSGAIDTVNNIMITFGSGKQTGTFFTTDLWVLTNPNSTPTPTPTATPNGM